MTTASKPRPRVKPERRVRLYGADSNPMLLEMTIGAELFAYFVTKIDGGFAFRKCPDCVHEIDDAVYRVHCDPATRLSTCTCKGNTYCGHCKHIESILALIQSGKIAVPAGKQQPATVEPAKPAADPWQEIQGMRAGENREVTGRRVERVAAGWRIAGRFAASKNMVMELLAF